MKRFIGPLSIIVPYVVLGEVAQSVGDIVLAFPFLALIGPILGALGKAKGRAGAAASKPTASSSGAPRRKRKKKPIRNIAGRGAGSLGGISSLLIGAGAGAKSRIAGAPGPPGAEDLDTLGTLIRAMSSKNTNVGL